MNGAQYPRFYGGGNNDVDTSFFSEYKNLSYAGEFFDTAGAHKERVQKSKSSSEYCFIVNNLKLSTVFFRRRDYNTCALHLNF